MTQEAPAEPMNITEPIRCALARHEAGFAWQIDHEDVAKLLAAYDALAPSSTERK